LPAAKHRQVPDPLSLEVGIRIRRFRRLQNFSFDAFVEESGLGRGYVSELERGLVIPSLKTLAAVARTLDLTIADLVAGESDREVLFSELRGVSSLVIRQLRRELIRQGWEPPPPPSSHPSSAPPPRGRTSTRPPRRHSATLPKAGK
jgi:transcriptional regulator with XRE-family HTH domain